MCSSSLPYALKDLFSGSNIEPNNTSNNSINDYNLLIINTIKSLISALFGDDDDDFYNF